MPPIGRYREIRDVLPHAAAAGGRLVSVSAPGVSPTRQTGRGPFANPLMRYGRATRLHFALTVILGSAAAALVVAQAWLIAWIVSGAFVEHRELAQLRGPVTLLLAVVVGRASVAWYTEVAASRTAAGVKSQLRHALVDRVAAGGPTVLQGHQRGDLAVLATRGIDALDGYYSRYVPQLVLAVIVPTAVLLVVAGQDWISAAIILVTLPLIPLFMVLIGLATRLHTDRRLRALQLLSGHFLDVVAGLTTLKVFGRSKAQVTTIRAVTDAYRRTTMTTLRIAFLSSLVLELLASVAVALVAVSVGLRLLHGHLDLRTSLLILVLAPEAYLPLRLVGTHFHASAEGMSAATQVFDVLDTPLPEPGTGRDLPDVAASTLAVANLSVTYPGTDRPALDRCSLTVAPGETVAITGPSGCGKSTLLAVLLGFVAPNAGAVSIGDVDLATVEPDIWRGHLAWLPQRPHLFAGSIAENVRLGRPEATDDEVRAALADAGLAPLLARSPQGIDTTLGERGSGVSVGERQRIALARAFLRDVPLLLLDEPTANLDGDSEAEVVEAIRRLARGRTVVLVAHRPALVGLADRVVALATTGVVSA